MHTRESNMIWRVCVCVCLHKRRRQKGCKKCFHVQTLHHAYISSWCYTCSRNELRICEYNIHLLHTNRSNFIKINPHPTLIYCLFELNSISPCKNKNPIRGNIEHNYFKGFPKSTTRSYMNAGPQTTLNGCSPNMVAVIFLNWMMKITRAFCLALCTSNMPHSFLSDSLPISHLHIHWDINYLFLSTMTCCITMCRHTV